MAKATDSCLRGPKFESPLWCFVLHFANKVGADSFGSLVVDFVLEFINRCFATRRLFGACQQSSSSVPTS